MSLKNPLGDLELTDPQAMRALAHPVRLAILEQLQRHGPATATQLAPAVGATPSVTSWHLRHLAGFGLVRDSDAGTDRRQRWWEAAARGFRFEASGDEESQSAARVLSRQLFRQSDDLPHKWMAEDEPRLDGDGGGWAAWPTPGWCSAPRARGDRGGDRAGARALRDPRPR